MRLRQPRTTALLLLLPALHVYAAKIITDPEPTSVVRAAAESSDLAALAAATPAAGARGTKDAPVDGFDGKPHEGPYVDDKPVPSKKGPGGIEELRPGSRLSPAQDMTKEELAAIAEEDDSVMNDPNRAAPKGNTGTEGGVSKKDKERLAHEDKTGSKMEKIPESPKEAPVPPHGEQQHMKENQESETDTESRVLGAQGLEVSLSNSC
jgi:hypothetical protein